ncbi:MAG TPA: hypothetical protein VIL46_15115 [Gemmataceae bacterium]
MIVFPRRSVTRFFIPLIDVLILLFAIFLLMPFVSQPALEEGGGEEAARRFEADDRRPPPPDAAELRRELDRARRELDRLRRARGDVAENLSVQVLQIDKTTGHLYYLAPGRREVRTQQEAQQLIDAHRRRSGTREPFFLILYPRELSGYPTQEQVEDYRRWFRDVPHAFDNPLAL